MAETWRQRHHRATREELLAVARGMMLEEGIDGLGVRELARRTRFSPASLYTYFSGKDEILAAITAESSRELEEYLDRVPGDAAPAERLTGLCRAYLDFAEENPADFACIVEVGLRGGVAGAAAFTGIGGLRRRLDAALRAHVLQASAARRSAAASSDAVAGAGSQIADIAGGQTADVAVGLWAEIHGLAVLRQAGLAFPAGDSAAGAGLRALAALEAALASSR